MKTPANSKKPSKPVAVARESKPKFVFASKTIFANLLAIGTVLGYPPAAAVVAAHPEESVALFGVVNLVLRLVTRERVALFPEDDRPFEPNLKDDDIPY